MARPKSHAQRLKELADAHAQERDPEDVGGYGSDSDDSDAQSNPDIEPGSARAHYESVGKSKLRKPQAVSLGPRYAGSAVRRAAVDQDDEDDPFSREFSGSESDSGDGIYEDGGPVVGVQHGAEAANGFAESSDEEDEDVEDNGRHGDFSDDDDNDENDDAIDTEDDVDDDMDDGSIPAKAQSTEQFIDRSELRKLLANDQKTVAARLTESAKADVDKGRAVKAQRATFDALLNTRIKLQKALVATNSILALETSARQQGDDGDVIVAAETAAFTLWNNLNDLRTTLQTSQAGQKRSHRQFTREDSLDALWEETKSYEAAQKKPRVATLDFWATKTRTTTTLPQTRGRLQHPVREQQLSDVLAGQLADISRLVAKTQVARSCAPIQAASVGKGISPAKHSTNGVDQHDGDHAEDGEITVKAVETLPIYDDADFYTTLLASLISQRSTDTATINLSNLTLQPWQAAREARTKKVVDTKASKGRKLRYTVHEKLVSFMAPEDRGTWGERQADELFGSLFGRRIALADVDDNERDGDALGAEEEDAEIEGLRLFGGR